MRETGIMGTGLTSVQLLAPTASSLSLAVPAACHSPPHLAPLACGQSTELLGTCWSYSHFPFLGARGLVISPGFQLPLPAMSLGSVLGTRDKEGSHTWALP